MATEWKKDYNGWKRYLVVVDNHLEVQSTVVEGTSLTQAVERANEIFKLELPTDAIEEPIYSYVDLEDDKMLFVNICPVAVPGEHIEIMMKWEFDKENIIHHNS